jgi:hypothetical protein
MNLEAVPSEALYKASCYTPSNIGAPNFPMTAPSAPSRRRRQQSPTYLPISRRNQGSPTSPAAISPAASSPATRLPSPGLLLRSGGLPNLSTRLGLPPGLGFAVNRAGRSLQEVGRAPVAPNQAPLEHRTLVRTLPTSTGQSLL